MKLKTSLATGAALSFVMFGALAPSAAFAASSITFSASTICPGESILITTNGFSDGTVVPLTAPEYSAISWTNQPIPVVLGTTGDNGVFPYGAFEPFIGQTYTYSIVTATNVNDPTSITSTVSSASVNVLAECGSAPEPDPAPTPTDSGLPNTGIDLSIAGMTLGSALAIAFAGFFIIRVSNLLNFASANQKVSARMKRLDAVLGRMENSARRSRNNRR